MNNNINCESCYQYICECKQIIVEQAAIERLQEMPVADAVLKMWQADAEVDVIARTLRISSAKVLEVLDA